MPNLSLTKINSFLANLSNWTLSDNSIQKNFIFATTTDAFQFLIKVATLAEQLKHHPDWSGTKNIVHIKLTSHDANGVTLKDIELATTIESLYLRHK